MAEKKMTKPGYAGKIGNSGVINVKAPFAPGKKPAGKVKRGTDLRSGK